MKRLLRSRRDRVFAGVAGGIAEYFEVDPTLVRLAWVAAGLSGIGVFVYVVAAIIVPENQSGYVPPPQPVTVEQAEQEGLPPLPDQAPYTAQTAHDGGAGARSFGYILVAVGLYMLVRRFVPWFSMNRLWPVALILLGAYLVAGGMRSGK